MSKLDFKPTSKAAASTEFIEHADLDAAALEPREGVIDVIANGEREITKFVWMLAGVAGISGFLFGWDTAVIGGALGNIGSDLGHVLNSVETEWATASLSAGAIAGSLIGGSASDKIGRKKVLFIGDILFLLGGLLICAAFSYEQFIVGRVLMGGGTGIAAVTCAVYLGEVAPSLHRGRIVAVQSVMITFGQLCAYAVSAGLDSVHNGWRILFALSLPFALFQGIFIEWWAPETPRFAVIQGDLDGARKTLTRVYPKATPDQLEVKLKAIEVATEVSVSLKKTHPTLAGRLYAVLTTPKYLRCTTVAAVVFLGQQMVGWNTFLYYSSTLFGAAGFTNTSAVGILVAGLNCLGTLLSMFTMDRVGRRRMFLIGLPIALGALIVASVAFHFMTESTAGQLLDGQDYPKKWVGLMIAMICIFILGNAPSIGTLAYTTIELVPLEVRGLGSAIATSFQWSGNLIVSSTFLTMLKSLTAAGTYGLYAGFCLLTLVFIYFCYPESAGLTLEETGTLFEHGFGVRRADELRAAKRAGGARDLEGAGGSSTGSLSEKVSV